MSDRTNQPVTSTTQAPAHLVQSDRMSEDLDAGIRAREGQVLARDDSDTRNRVPHADKVDVDVSTEAGLEACRERDALGVCALI
jgi:hypothetical protein